MCEIYDDADVDADAADDDDDFTSDGAGLGWGGRRGMHALECIYFIAVG